MPFGQTMPSSLNLPTVAPAFNFDFRNGQQLDSRITFTRLSSAASHFNERSVLVADSTSIPRFNFKAGVSKGLLIEAAETNLSLKSEEFDNAQWVKTACSISANAVTAPNGLLVADKIIENTATSSHNIAPSGGTFAVDDLTEYEAGFFLKAAGRTIVEISVRFGTTVYGQCFDLSNGVLHPIISGNVQATNSHIESIGNGWYYCALRQTTNGVLAYNRVYLSDGAAISYTGDGTSGVYVFGAIFAKTPNKTYIPTTSAAVTRALDLATVSSSNFNYWRSDEMSFLVEFTGQATGTACYNGFSDGTANERIYLESVSGTLTLKIVDGGVEQCSLALGTVATGTDYRVAVAIKLNDVAASINGAVCVTDTSVTLPTITVHNIGSNYAGANQCNSEIAVVRGWATRLSNTTLEALSA